MKTDDHNRSFMDVHMRLLDPELHWRPWDYLQRALEQARADWPDIAADPDSTADLPLDVG